MDEFNLVLLLISIPSALVAAGQLAFWIYLSIKWLQLRQSHSFHRFPLHLHQRFNWRFFIAIGLLLLAFILWATKTRAQKKK